MRNCNFLINPTAARDTLGFPPYRSIDPATSLQRRNGEVRWLGFDLVHILTFLNHNREALYHRAKFGQNICIGEDMCKEQRQTHVFVCTEVNLMNGYRSQCEVPEIPSVGQET
jgi:hypothetical protein